MAYIKSHIIRTECFSMPIRSFFHKKMTKAGMKITYSPISVEKCTEWQNLTILRSIRYCTSLTNLAVTHKSAVLEFCA